MQRKVWPKKKRTPAQELEHQRKLTERITASVRRGMKDLCSDFQAEDVPGGQKDEDPTCARCRNSLSAH